MALSLGSPPLDVIQHHALRSPDFPLPYQQAATILSSSTKLYLIYIIILLTQKQKSLAVGTGNEIFSMEKIVIDLGG